MPEWRKIFEAEDSDFGGGGRLVLMMGPLLRRLQRDPSDLAHAPTISGSLSTEKGDSSEAK
jgi:hypothetical protein